MMSPLFQSLENFSEDPESPEYEAQLSPPLLQTGASWGSLMPTPHEKKSAF